ncbi:MAG: hypothetical protein IJX67_00010 [Oscillospiraceae bacterium]|nr:hypothetical protein [Oscillospiraceae bacterium]
MPKTKRNTNPSKRGHDDQASSLNAPSIISIEQDQFVLEQTNVLINNADTKVSVSCGLISAVFAIVAFFCENFATEISRKTVMMYPSLFFCAVTCAIAAALAFLIALLSYFSAISPRFWGFKKNQKSQPTYSIFFEDISAFARVEKYVDCAMHATEKQYHEEIRKEIYFNSQICSEKMHKYKIGLIISFLSLLLAIAATVLFIVLASKAPCDCMECANPTASVAFAGRILF